MKFAFHVHTCYSKDSWSKPKDIINYCRKHSIGAIAICDHDEIGGAFECQKLADGNPIVIIGEEIKTTEGEIIGLFLDEKIPAGLSIEETIGRIKEQDGLVCLPHPGEILRKESVSRKCIRKIIDKVDIIEIYNSRTLLPKDNEWALWLGTRENKLKLLGSDAHFIVDVTKVLNNVELFNNKESFFESLKSNDISGVRLKQTSLITQGFSKVVKLVKKIRISH